MCYQKYDWKLSSSICLILLTNGSYYFLFVSGNVITSFSVIFLVELPFVSM